MYRVQEKDNIQRYTVHGKYHQTGNAEIANECAHPRVSTMISIFVSAFGSKLLPTFISTLVHSYAHSYLHQYPSSKVHHTSYSRTSRRMIRKVTAGVGQALLAFSHTPHVRKRRCRRSWKQPTFLRTIIRRELNPLFGYFY